MWEIDFSKVLQFFVYDPKSPMIFTSGMFLLVFCIILPLFLLVEKHHRLKLTFLTLFSFYFYYKSSGWFVLLLVYTAVLDYWMAKLVHRSKKESTQKWIIALSVTLNLALLGYFKYTYFFVELLQLNLSLPEILLPVGISFFTFQSISYIIDVYRKDIEPVDNFLDYVFFISFFPQLVAGPIVKAKEFIPQINKKYQLQPSEFAEGFYLVFAGLIKKMVISDYISINFVDRVFESPGLYSGFENLMAVYGYAIQIYCDFSGYTDMAIGIALWLGYRLPLNFNHPYLAENITDFWRRWHISLSTWLREYLYIPLGGNRKGKFRQYINLFITMLLGGFWHGASLNFIIWGALHGIALAVHKFVSDSWSSIHKLGKVGGIIITFHFVCFCWIFFRAGTTEIVKEMLGQIFFAFNFSIIPDVLLGYRNVFILIALGFIIHFLPTSIKQFGIQRLSRAPLWTKVVAFVLVILFIGQIKSAEIQPFIYFQF